MGLSGALALRGALADIKAAPPSIMTGTEIFLVIVALMFPVGILGMLWRMRSLAKRGEKPSPMAPGWEDTKD